jgi:hypothetical protein
MRNTTHGAEVIYVDGDGKDQKGTIIEVISQGAARIACGKNTVQASYSPDGEKGSFHYPDEAKTAKAAPATPPPNQPAAKEPAANN